MTLTGTYNLNAQLNVADQDMSMIGFILWSKSKREDANQYTVNLCLRLVASAGCG